MKRSFLPLFCAALAFTFPGFAAQEPAVKTYECRYVENAPYGVAAWSGAGFIKDPANRESRFLAYDSDAAKNLVLDATQERDVTRDETAAVRNTFFAMAYNDRGWSIYIQGEEPLARQIVDSLIDPKSPARHEGYEVFFTPGLHNVPYYQLLIKSFADTVKVQDWGTEHRHYRSLAPFLKVESLPLEKGVGTFIFIPWEALYDRLPLGGEPWRFSVIRWMPFSKAGGVTWGGQVHNTGNFGQIRFQPPTAEQKAAIERKVLRAAWFKFLADSAAATKFWSDEKVGDPAFYNGTLKPEIDAATQAGQALGDPEAWTAAEVQKGWSRLGDWMEFPYKVSELRTGYLLDKRFAQRR